MREVWVLVTPAGESYMGIEEPMGYDWTECSKYKMREVDGENTPLTRLQVLEAFGQAYCSSENSNKVLDEAVAFEVIRLLFGEARAELVSYHQMAAEGVWIPSMDYAQIIDERDKLEKFLHEMDSRCTRYRVALELIAGGSNFQCEVGERNCIAAAKQALSPAATGQKEDE